MFNQHKKKIVLTLQLFLDKKTIEKNTKILENII